MTKVLAALLGLALPRCAEPVVVVACAGDSITAGGHGAGHDYPALLQDLLGDGYEVHNFGRSGTTVGDGDGFKPWRDSGGYDDMMETRFDVGIVSLGTNDAKESLWGAIEDDWVATYVDLIEELRSASPGAYFYVGATTPYICCSGKWGDDTSVINEELPALARDVADAVGGSVMDFRSALGGDDIVEDYYDDKIHPNEKGYAAMAAEAAATLLGGVPATTTPRPSYEPSYAPSYEPTARPTAAAVVSALRADRAAVARAEPRADGAPSWRRAFARAPRRRRRPAAGQQRAGGQRRAASPAPSPAPAPPERPPERPPDGRGADGRADGRARAGPDAACGDGAGRPRSARLRGRACCAAAAADGLCATLFAGGAPFDRTCRATCGFCGPAARRGPAPSPAPTAGPTRGPSAAPGSPTPRRRLGRRRARRRLPRRRLPRRPRPSEDPSARRRSARATATPSSFSSPAATATAADDAAAATRGDDDDGGGGGGAGARSRPVGAAPPPPPKSGWVPLSPSWRRLLANNSPLSGLKHRSHFANKAVPEAESPGADAYDVDIDSPGDPPAPSPFPNIERALFPDDEEVKEDPYRPLVHGASDIDFDEHGDAVEFGRVSDGSSTSRRNGGRDIRTDCAAAARSAVAAVDGLAAPVAPGAAPAASLVVDLGCGTAASTRGLRAAFPEADVLAYDTSPPFLRTARLLTNVVGGAKPVVFKERNAEATGLADGSADVVSIQFVLHEVPQQGRAALIAEAKRVLRPGGLLMVLDIAQEYSPSPAMAEGEPYVWGYMRNIKRDLSKAGFVSLEETKVVPNHATMWLCRTNIMPRPAGKNNILKINLGDAGLATKRRDAARDAIAAVAEAA
ncbi:methyltransferase domain-containing protein [Aureococcus anophagefferens]|nr:methyltransferase domain-containing protein [Aureococcus anophagefferens]